MSLTIGESRDLGRIADTLESIAKSLEKIANPPFTVSVPATFQTTPTAPTYVPPGQFFTQCPYCYEWNCKKTHVICNGTSGAQP